MDLVRRVDEALPCLNLDRSVIAERRNDSLAQCSLSGHWVMMAAAIRAGPYSIRYNLVSHPGRPFTGVEHRSVRRIVSVGAWLVIIYSDSTLPKQDSNIYSRGTACRLVVAILAIITCLVSTIGTRHNR